jgi:hypothetical protein
MEKSVLFGNWKRESKTGAVVGCRGWSQRLRYVDSAFAIQATLFSAVFDSEKRGALGSREGGLELLLGN